MTSELSEKAVREIRATMQAEFAEQRRKFWISPEEHYRQHIEIDELLKAFREGRTFFTRAFIGLAVVGLLLAALFALNHGRG